MLRSRLSVLMLGITLVAPLGAVAPTDAATMYAVGFDATNSPVYTIDSDTGVQTFLGNSGVANLNALSLSPSGVLYAAGGTAGSNVLVTLDPTTGAATSSVTVNTGTSQSFIRSLAFDSAGTLWAGNQPTAGLPMSGQTRLYTINPTTGVGTAIGFMGFVSMEGMDFSSSGTLYGVAGDGLRTINTATGVSTLVGPAVTNTFESIAFGPDGTLWGTETGVSSSKLYTIDPATGARTLTFFTGLNTNLRGIDFVQPVPVPAALWLFGSGLAAMVGFARRKP